MFQVCQYFEVKVQSLGKRWVNSLSSDEGVRICEMKMGGWELLISDMIITKMESGERTSQVTAVGSGKYTDLT